MGIEGMAKGMTKTEAQGVATLVIMGLPVYAFIQSISRLDFYCRNHHFSDPADCLVPVCTKNRLREALMKKRSGDIFLSANESFFLVEQAEEQLVGF